MIIPSIDLQDGQTVQLVGGKDKALDAGDPRPLLDRFGRVGPVAVIDLDAAMGTGSNAGLVRDLCRRGRVRVGGGIRSVDAALDWLDAGAEQVILGTAARPELLSQLPRERVIAALDAVDGEVVVEGWQTRTGASILERMEALAPHVGGFLVTFVEREGRLGGTDLDRVPALVEAAGDARITIAGGVTTAEEIAALDRMGCDAQVGMALYTGRISLAEAFAAPLRSDRPDGLWPTVVADEHGVALGLAYSDAESLARALETGRGVYHSRRRGLWEKGATSGDVQELLAVSADCDRDALRFTVRQHGEGFCHEGTWTCFGESGGLPALARILASRRESAPPTSYSKRLYEEPGLLAAKLREEAHELAEALESWRGAPTPAARAEVAHEVADVMFFALVAAASADLDLDEITALHDARARRVRRRRGDAKPAFLSPPSLPGDASSEETP